MSEKAPLLRLKLKSFRIPILFLLFGTLWALTSDPLITFLAKHHTLGITDSIRGFNDFLFVLVSASLLYWQISVDGRALRASERQYRGLFMANPNAMWLYDTETMKFMFVNDAAVTKYGYTREEFAGMTIFDIRPPSEHDRLMQSIKENPGGYHTAGVWQHMTRSGETLFVAIASQRLVFNKRPASLVMSTDITESIQSKERLEELTKTQEVLISELEHTIRLKESAMRESRTMGQVINKIYNLVLIVGPDGTIAWVNKAFVNFTGFTLNEATGKRPHELLFGPETDLKVAARLARAIEKRKYFDAEIVNYKKNGEPYWVQINISPIFDESGKFEFFVSVENVVTDRKKRDELLKRQYEAFKQVAWSNSHEVRRPLASILGILGLLKEVDDSEKPALMSLLETCANELDNIVTDNVLVINDLQTAVKPFDEDHASDISHGA